MPAPTLQFKRGLFSNLPGLRAGEPGFTTDSYELYVGIDSTTQNNKFFGSHRYWTRETTTTGSGVNFVEGTNNGTDFITIKAPGTLAGIVTFTLPGADGSNGQILTTNGSGTLSFSSPSSSSFTIVGGTGTDTFNTGGTLTFAGTANEIETAVTNDQVQIGLPDNVIITGVITATNGFAGNLTGNVTGNINSSGVSTVTSLVATNINASGIITATNGFVGNLTGTASSTTNIPNLTGAITSVNTTTSLGSFSSSNLATALTDETGSGSAVFATSPTLVTPALGDATATTIVTSGAVNVGTALSAPTVKTATIQHSNATNAATIDASGNITAAQNLTISGNLFVNGSTTQVNTAAITVEDRTIELGVVDGAAPTSATTWDLGILFNYYATTAKKSAVIWEHGDARFKFASVLTADTDGSTVDTPQLAVTTFAPIEIASLFVNDCAGASQVISCTGTTRNLENITVDCGSF